MENKRNNTAHHVSSAEIPTVLGGCLCGAVRFAVKTRIDAVMCHCKQCQKAQGAAFGCNFPVLAADFEYISGEDKTKQYKSSPSKLRTFCSTCGSPIFSRKSATNTLRIRSGTLDSSSDVNVGSHIFARSAAKWAPILDNLPQHDEFEPGRVQQ